ncbi:MAG: hypothetical protein FWF71_02100 [Actinomycetia bacterium]|nr:hypothetical protein [Actinomycetes bacterium]
MSRRTSGGGSRSGSTGQVGRGAASRDSSRGAAVFGGARKSAAASAQRAPVLSEQRSPTGRQSVTGSYSVGRGFAGSGSVRGRDFRSGSKELGAVVQKRNLSFAGLLLDKLKTGLGRGSYTGFSVVFILVVAMLFAGLMVYGPAASAWADIRLVQQMQAEEGAIEARNNQIAQLIGAIKTPEGIESRAREEYGWVRAGEQAVNIVGLDIASSSTSLPASIEPGSVQAPTQWWTATLDTIFHYSPSSPSVAPVPSADASSDVSAGARPDDGADNVNASTGD